MKGQSAIYFLILIFETQSRQVQFKIVWQSENVLLIVFFFFIPEQILTLVGVW